MTGAGVGAPPESGAEDAYQDAPFGYLSTLPDGTIVAVNRTLLAWTGRPRDELLAGKRFQDLLTVPGRVFHETHYAPLLRMQGFVNEVAFDLLREGGRELPVLVNAVQKSGTAGGPVLVRAFLFNATDRRRYERELLLARRRADEAAEELRRLNETLERRVAAEVAERLRAEEALRQAQKMEAIGQLTGGVAHDFNNLLTVVLGGLEAIGRQLPALPDGPEVTRIRRSREMALEGVRRGATLTRRLLAFARRQPLDPKPVDANALVAGMSGFSRTSRAAGRRSGAG